MAINSVGENLATNGEIDYTKTVKDKTALGKDDFMKLLLVELQHQDPTEPMDSEKILTQTSQLATLESSQNTTDALEKLSNSMLNTQEFSTIAAIGKRADLGSDAVTHDEGSNTKFEVYFPEDIKSGNVEISDVDGNVIATIPIEMDEDAAGNKLDKKDAGVYQFEWDGFKKNGDNAESGVYHINAKYRDPELNEHSTRLGAYPIESVKFEEGKAFVKLGSSYVPLSSIVEVY